MSNNLLRDIEISDSKESRETVDSVANQIKMETYKTNIKKEAFVRDLQNGLGSRIKENPNGVIFTKVEQAKAKKERWNNLSFFGKIGDLVIRFFKLF